MQCYSQAQPLKTDIDKNNIPLTGLSIIGHHIIAVQYIHIIIALLLLQSILYSTIDYFSTNKFCHVMLLRIQSIYTASPYHTK